MSKEVSSKATASSGIGFPDLLTITFIILKLCGVITWSWWWVLSPLWISFGVFLALILAGLLAAIVVTIVVATLE